MLPLAVCTFRHWTGTLPPHLGLFRALFRSPFRLFSTRLSPPPPVPALCPGAPAPRASPPAEYKSSAPLGPVSPPPPPPTCSLLPQPPLNPTSPQSSPINSLRPNMHIRATSSVLFLLCPLLLPSPVCPNAAVPRELANEGIGNKAGVKARLSQRGVNYIATFLTDLLIEEVAGTGPSGNSEEIGIQIGAERAQLSELSLNVQKRPLALKTRTEAPKQAVVEMPAVSFTCKAKLAANGHKGSVQFAVPDATLVLNVSAVKHVQGSPNFRIERCQLLSHNTVVSVQIADGERAQLERRLQEGGGPMLEQLVCSRIVAVLEERINRRFAFLPSKMTLSNLNGTFIVDEVLRRMRRDSRKRRSAAEGSDEAGPDPDLFASFNVSRADSLFLDYTIVADMRADAKGMEIDSSGEVSMRGRGGTPFGPVEMKLPETVSEDHMLQMLVSDFMPNSLLYHGHTIGLFNARVDPKTPHFGSIMRTTCPTSTGLLFCLGDFFPTLRRVHPDNQLALLFSTVQPPVLKFRPQSAGGIAFSMLGKIVMIIIRSKETAEEKEVAQMEISVDAHMKLRLTSTTVRPKVTLDAIKLKTLSPGILVQEELDRSVLLSREVLQRMVNDILKNGIPIPVHPLLRLHKPKVKILDRALLLLTNVEFNETLMRQITSANLEKRGQK